MPGPTWRPSQPNIISHGIGGTLRVEVTFSNPPHAAYERLGITYVAYDTQQSWLFDLQTCVHD